MTLVLSPKERRNLWLPRRNPRTRPPDNEGGTVINIALPEDISEEQELKIAALVEDNEILYNQTTKEFKNKTKKGCSQILWRQLMSQGTPRFTSTSQQESNIPTVFEHTIPRDQAAQHQHNSTPSTVSSLGANPSSVTSSRDSSLNISSLLNTMVDSPCSQDSPMNRQGDIE
ncbi:unnamed protein product [Mytilus coruscus]|uniref:Uncharacterized protein n=1 Tax=Mytilus coruscus TaxID=42192 RepID=A0A6J8D0K3_MYTCO|nr:unnamed protein product [Mytilus coruscus]